MKISAIRSDKVYSKIMNAPLDKKNDIYRYELMKPFEKKWACYSVPMKALTPNGYDVIMASEMLGHIAPTAVDQKQQNNIKLISDNTLWEKCELSIQQSLNCFVEHGVNLPIKEYAFTILLANAKNPYIILNDGYCGDGGIPGYIFSWLLPNPDKPEKLFLFSTPCVILKKKGVFICYSLINTLIKFMASLPVMTA
ncbi:MAG: DUF2268 domain-containing putative Zn-dependent protease [Anaerobutyricum soehngenii]